MTSAPDAVADPLPQNVREILAIPRDKRTPRADAGGLQLLAHHGARVAATRTTRSPSCGSEYPEGASQLVLDDRDDEPRETHILKRGDFLQAGQSGDAGRARVPESAARRTLRRTG